MDRWAGSTQVSNSLTLIRTCYLDSTVFALGGAKTCLSLSSPHVKRAGALLPQALKKPLARLLVCLGAGSNLTVSKLFYFASLIN